MVYALLPCDRLNVSHLCFKSVCYNHGYFKLNRVVFPISFWEKKKHLSLVDDLQPFENLRPSSNTPNLTKKNYSNRFIEKNIMIILCIYKIQRNIEQ